MKALLVGNPRTVKGFNRMTKVPSLNLASLAANVNKDECEVKIADLVLHDRNPGVHLLKILESWKPDIVGFTAMSFQYRTALSLARLTRQNLPSALIIMGGYHVTADLDAILQSDDMQYIDYLVNGEGETTFRAFIHQCANGKKMDLVPGLSYLENGLPRHNPRAPLLDCAEIAIPDRDARIYKKGFHIMGMPGDVIETSRGCVYNCNFCSIRNMYGKSFRKFTNERILTDLEDAGLHGAKAIFITDDNITLDGKRYMALCEEIIRAKLDMKFCVQASVRGLKNTPGLIDAMARSGTIVVFLGIENASDDALQFMHKDDQLKSADTVQVVAELKKHNIIVVGGFIFGNPEDTKETLLQNFDYAKKIGIDLQLFNILTPHLGTEIRDELIQQGLVTNLTDYTKYNHYASNVKTNYLGSDELYRIRNMLDARFPVESGAIFRMFRMYPLFFTGLMFRMLKDEPRNWLNFVTGITRKFI